MLLGLIYIRREESKTGGSEKQACSSVPGRPSAESLGNTGARDGAPEPPTFEVGVWNLGVLFLTSQCIRAAFGRSNDLEQGSFLHQSPIPRAPAGEDTSAGLGGSSGIVAVPSIPQTSEPWSPCSLQNLI